MPHYKLDNALSVEMLNHIQSRLPMLEVHTAIDFSAAHEDLQCYFDTYGFQLMKCLEHAGYSLGYLDAVNGRIACHCWCPQSARATIFICHGLFDHVGLYLDLIDTLVLQGYMVVAIDFPGHGLSSAHPREIADFADYSTIIDTCLKCLSRDIPEPIYGIGQSTGCAALMSYSLLGQGSRISRLALLAPLIQVRKWPWVSIGQSVLNPWTRHVKRTFKMNSHRESFCDFLRNADPLQPKEISVKWIGAMKKWHKGFNQLPESSIKTLVVQGTGDSTVLWERNLPRIQSKLPDCQILMLDEAMHHLVNEGDTWRDTLFESLQAFFDEA